MLRVIAIDDEMIALERFQRISGQDENIKVLGCFTKSQDAMDFLSKNEIDVVFLDIEMPRVNGLELSEQIFEIKPEIDVVFVTAYDKYALQAIQAHAMGYLLKPLEVEDIKLQTEKLIKKRLARKTAAQGKQLSVTCMGQFKIFSEGEGGEPIKWRTAKAEELFAYLVHSQGKEISKDRLIDTLWPEMDAAKVSNNLHVTCHYIRDVLHENGYSDIFIRTRGSYQVKKEKIKCDFLDLLDLMKEAKSENDDLKKLETIAEIYQGPYLDDKTYDWAGEMRTWMESEYEQSMYKLVNFYNKERNIEKAIDLLKRITLNIPYADAAYKLLVEMYMESGDYISARHYYQKYEKILTDELGILPPKELAVLMNKQ